MRRGPGGASRRRGGPARARSRSEYARIMSCTRAEQTLSDAMERSTQLRGRHEIAVAHTVLDPEETVYELLRCARKGNSWPVLAVTDRRILYTEHGAVTRWRVKGQVPAGEVVGARFESRFLSRREHVQRRSGDPLTVKVSDEEWPQHVVSLINHLAAGGAPPSV